MSQTTHKTLPIIDGLVTFDPKDAEVIKILGFICPRAGPMAELFRRAGYPIPRHAEEEQAHCIAWMLAMHQKHGRQWRTIAVNFLQESRTAPKEQP